MSNEKIADQNIQSQHKHAAVFATLDRTLVQSRKLWQPQPFIDRSPDWIHSHSHIYHSLLALSDPALEELSSDVQALAQWFKSWEPDLYQDLTCFNVPRQEEVDLPGLNTFDDVGVPGRKWEQITAFANAMPSIDASTVDWCAGKGHLSRVIQRTHGGTVHCLEWDADLVASGRQLARKQKLDLKFYQHDVLQPLPEPLLAQMPLISQPKILSVSDNVEPAPQQFSHVGLHACGELHMQLIRCASSMRAPLIVLSPCCYHKIEAQNYRPLSTLGMQSTLLLARRDLHLAVQETVTAGRRQKRLRAQERHWRLAFDLLQRDCRLCDEYLSVPSLKQSQLAEDFVEFCHWAADKRKIELGRNIDFADYLARAEVLERRVTRLELLRQVFKRPLELWLILDRALYLEQQGYRVSISEFCDRQVTPRNLLLTATLA